MTNEKVDQDKIQKKPVATLTVNEGGDGRAHAHERDRAIWSA
jgi:hypothetical protein